MTHTPPCAQPDADPNDWFLSKDGKQYPDEDFLTELEVRGITASVIPIEGESDEQHRDRVDAAISAAEHMRRRAALQSRRHAKDACHTDCYFRTACLDKALERDEVHGTWGGYYEEELREIRREIARRRRRGRPN